MADASSDGLISLSATQSASNKKRKADISSSKATKKARTSIVKSKQVTDSSDVVDTQGESEVDEVEVLDLGGGTGKNPANRNFYSEQVRRIMNAACFDFLARIITNFPFANEETLIVEAKAAFARANTSYGQTTPPTGAQIKNVRKISLMR